MDLFLGVDTSNYTTSLALTNEKGELVKDCRKVLEVKLGEKGLRQSEAFFQHVKYLPLLFAEIFDKIEKENLRAIAVSTKPRPVTGSYMPVFLAGKSMAEIVAKSLSIPIIETTHQEGHIMAGLWSSGLPLVKEFLTVHISGGTTEILKVQVKNSDVLKFNIEKLGGTTDLHAGQFVDRIGVRMGLSFPAGPKLELLAQESTNPCRLPLAVDGLKVSFSGPESHAQRLLNKGENYADVARGVEICLLKSLQKIIENAHADTKIDVCLLVGGVVSNQYIRSGLSTGLQRKGKNFDLYFASPRFSSDNAVGVSLIAKSIFTKGGITNE